MGQEEHDELEQARATLVKMRRGWIKVLAGEYKRGEAEVAAQKIVEIQQALGAIEHAKKEEVRDNGTERSGGWPAGL